MSDIGTMQINQPAVDDWLLHRSYYGIQDMSGHQVSYGYQLQNDHYSQSHTTHPYDNSLDARYSDFDDGRSDTMPMNMSQYGFPPISEASAPEDNHTVKRPADPWDWPTSGVKNVAIQDNLYSPELCKDTTSLKLSPSVVRPGAQTTPISKGLDDLLSSKVIASIGLTDLIPDPPTELVDPPSDDMLPNDKTMVPQRRNLRDPNHLYMPRWIRGDGKKREGWCGACRPGKWLSLKRSTYWCT
jgi:hypothetical protein